MMLIPPNALCSRAALLASITAGALLGSINASADEGFQLEEIVVTAQKREQSLLDVPASLSAFSAEKLDASGIENVLDLANFTPGLSVEPSRGGGGSLYIRGIGSNLLGAGIDPSVAVYHNGAYVARHVVAFQDFIDVERVEVLRGPQGTLYGRNATGGAINVIHKQPSDEFEFSGRLDGGNYDKQGIALAVSGELIEDKLYARASYSVQQRESYFENVYLDKVLDGEDSESVALTFVYRPTDNFEAILRYNDYENDAVGNQAYKNILRGPNTLAALEEPSDPFQVNNDYAPGDNTAATDAVSLELNWALGEIALKSLTSVRDIDASSTFDTDGTNLNTGFNIFIEDSEMVSQEFQLSTPIGDKLQLISGLYYYHEDNDSTLDFQYSQPDAACLGTGQPAPCVGLTSFVSTNETEAFAAFGELTYNASEEWRVTLGARYSEEEKTFDTFGGLLNNLFDASSFAGLPPGSFWLDASGSGTARDSDRWSDVTGRLMVEYDMTRDLMVYASVSEGFKSGGFNSSDPGVIVSPFFTGAGAQGSFDPETLTSYEIGIKGSMLGDRMRGSLSTFLYDYNDLQVRFVDSVNGTLPIRNAGGAEVFGIEFEGEAAISEHFRMDWTLTYLDSEYEDFGNAQDLVTGQPVDLSGQSLIRTPDLKLSLGAQYTFALGDLGSLTLRGEYLYQDEQKFGQSKDPFLVGGEYEYINARATWSAASGKWYVAAWGQNLTDHLYESSRTYNNLNGGAAIYGAPRTYGVTVGYHY
ncbi:TonB-dependent receptor [Pseudomaricurvus alkylphenolicus]|uniref:TonB-dependent receptor n=1 Tax=Pseudomaricurvus alkylphenolicus TaxID=1306991 RepID=UPI00142476CF|nr:TonB-dependent receptor [Pseudomaricurvus alkylphenolicus]NIB38675.1 TonB-dependent receptor [Pseudomaricurvus alkylphenolicus]